eukprot:CCRYP_009583-RA/>CCRYP_009583-RA protein AED:0.22 eAED:0.40 QI:0/0/0.33/1/0.5/0.33/3/381/188
MQAARKKAEEEKRRIELSGDVDKIMESLCGVVCLRGLEYSSTKAADLRGVAVVSRKMVLGVSYSDEDEDDYERRTYCSLLTLGANLDPSCTSYPSTAPGALRHWTPQQKSLLEELKKGQKLLQDTLSPQTKKTTFLKMTFYGPWKRCIPEPFEETLFLRGVTMEGVGCDGERYEIRKRLAEAYLSRNP